MKGRSFVPLLIAVLLFLGAEIVVFKTEAEAISDSVFDDFTSVRLENSNVYESKYVVGVANIGHGLVPAQKWGDPVNAGSGYVVYKLTARFGYKISRLNLVLNAKVLNLSNALYNVNNLKIYYSLDGVAYSLYDTVKANGDGRRDYAYIIDVPSTFMLFVKLEMNNYEGNLPLNQVGVKIFSVNLTYFQEETEELKETDNSVLSSSYKNENNYSGQIFNEGNGVGFCGNGYYEKPLSLDTGVEITFADIKLQDHSEYNSWLSFAVLSEKKAGNFLHRSSNGLYFMIFAQGETLKCNLIFVDNGKEKSLCNGLTVGKISDELKIKISRKQHSKSRALIVEVNGEILPNSQSGAIMNYKLGGANMCSYLCFGSFGGNANFTDVQMHSAVIRSIAYTDINGPKITFENVKDSYSVGVINLPKVIFEDESGVTYSRVRVFNSDGEKIEISSSKISVSKAGKYMLVAEAEDESGNITRRQIFINVE